MTQCRLLACGPCSPAVAVLANFGSPLLAAAVSCMFFNQPPYILTFLLQGAPSALHIHPQQPRMPWRLWQWTRVSQQPSSRMQVQCRVSAEVRGQCALQSVVELFLGLRLGAHFPSARLPYSEPGPACDDSADDADGDSDAEEPLLPAAAAKQACLCPDLSLHFVLPLPGSPIWQFLQCHVLRGIIPQGAYLLAVTDQCRVRVLEVAQQLR